MHLLRTITLLPLLAAPITGCVSLPPALEPGSSPITGYLDYSWDKNSVLFNTREARRRTVFFDTFYPFDPSLRYNYAEAMVHYELDHAPSVKNPVDITTPAIAGVGGSFSSLEAMKGRNVGLQDLSLSRWRHDVLSSLAFSSHEGMLDCKTCPRPVKVE